MTTSRTRSALNHATVVLGLSLTLFAGRAHADAVPQPPTDCLVGSQGNSCHGGTYCAPPAPCTTSAECSGGEVCQPTALCIGQVLCYGGIVTPDGGPTDFPQQSVEGLCPTGTCSTDAGATCTTLSICVSPGSTSSSGSSSSGGQVVIQNGCSCEAVGGSRGPIAIAALAVAVGLGLTSRRRRVVGGQRPARQRRP